MKIVLLSSAIVVFTISQIPTAYARPPLDCNRGASLTKAVTFAKANDIIQFTGNCVGPLTITQDGLRLEGQGNAVIDGQKQTVLTLRGAQNVILSNLEVHNGLNGISVDAQSQAQINNVTAYDNSLFGIALQNHSAATLKNVDTHDNDVNGLDAESSSAVTVTGILTSKQNGVFGININTGSSLSLIKSQVIAENNLLGIQLGTGASAFLGDSASSIIAKNNNSTGLTIVSGSHLVSFGGKITAQNNRRNGVSVNSKAGLDLDAASILESSNNGGNGVQLAESSVMTLFNTTAFSGQPGDTTLNTHDNAGNGIAILLGSNLTSVNQVLMFSQNNSGVGVLADNGSAITLLKATVNGNNTDISLSFGARSDIRNSSVGTITCDSSVISRGDKVCPPNP